MRILYIDIDSLRPDHLGCYGYHRNTSPNIDALASEGARILNLYASDTPCLPSRTAFFGGKFGARTGVVNHGGLCADLQPQGRSRDFRSNAAEDSLASLLTKAGYWTASISPFPRRHSAYQMTYGFNETVDTGRGGLENADEIFAEVQRRLSHRAKSDNWFLHVNMWDPHTPYDTPKSFGNPFEGEAIDGWLTQEIIDRQRLSYGPHSAREVPDYDSSIDPKRWPWGVGEIKCLEDAKVHIDGYDCGVAYADEYVGRIVNLLADAGVLEETAIIVAADHGENLGELNVWGDHQTADEFTNHIPGIVKWPGQTRPGSEIGGFFYHFDLAATLIELAGAKQPPGLDGKSMAATITTGTEGRDRLYLSQGAWSLQRSARWSNWLLIHTLDTGIKDFTEWMLFDLSADPHETRNVAINHEDLVQRVGAEMDAAFAELYADCQLGDPFEQVRSEGGPYHARSNGPERERYLKRLAGTGRGNHVEWLRANGNAPEPPARLAAY